MKILIDKNLHNRIPINGNNAYKTCTGCVKFVQHEKINNLNIHHTYHYLNGDQRRQIEIARKTNGQVMFEKIRVAQSEYTRK